MEARGSDLDHLEWLKAAGIDDFRGLSILDLGCGSGYLCHSLIQAGAKSAVGVDLVQPEVVGSGGWQFASLDLNSQDWHSALPGPFDLVFAFDILEHLDAPFLFLKNIYKSLNPTGQLFLTTPNALSWERFYKPHTWSGVQDPQHKVLFTKYSLHFLLQRIGFRHAKLRAPMRSLSFLGGLQPQIGGQIMCITRI